MRKLICLRSLLDRQIAIRGKLTQLLCVCLSKGGKRLMLSPRPLQNVERKNSPIRKVNPKIIKVSIVWDRTQKIHRYIMFTLNFKLHQCMECHIFHFFHHRILHLLSSKTLEVDHDTIDQGVHAYFAKAQHIK